MFLLYRSPSANFIAEKPVIPILVTSAEPEPAWRILRDHNPPAIAGRKPTNRVRFFDESTNSVRSFDTLTNSVNFLDVSTNRTRFFNDLTNYERCQSSNQTKLSDAITNWERLVDGLTNSVRLCVCDRENIGDEHTHLGCSTTCV